MRDLMNSLNFSSEPNKESLTDPKTFNEFFLSKKSEDDFCS